jgi:hypothetical protein
VATENALLVNQQACCCSKIWSPQACGCSRVRWAFFFLLESLGDAKPVDLVAVGKFELSAVCWQCLLCPEPLKKGFQKFDQVMADYRDAFGRTDELEPMMMGSQFRIIYLQG